MWGVRSPPSPTKNKNTIKPKNNVTQDNTYRLTYQTNYNNHASVLNQPSNPSSMPSKTGDFFSNPISQ